MNRKGVAAQWGFVKIAVLILALALVLWALFFNKSLYDGMVIASKEFLNIFK